MQNALRQKKSRKNPGRATLRCAARKSYIFNFQSSIYFTTVFLPLMM